MKTQSNQEMLKAFQEKLDSLLVVEVESSEDIFAEDEIDDDNYFTQLKKALDKQLENANIYSGWNIEVADDGIHILVINLDASMDEYVVAFDDDITYDLDTDVSNIIDEIDDMREDEDDKTIYRHNSSSIQDRVDSTPYGKYYLSAGNVPSNIKKDLEGPEMYDKLECVCKLKPRPEYKDELTEAYLTVNSKGEYEAWEYTDNTYWIIFPDELKEIDIAASSVLGTSLGKSTCKKIDRIVKKHQANDDLNENIKQLFFKIRRKCKLSDEDTINVMIDYLGFDADSIISALFPKEVEINDEDNRMYFKDYNGAIDGVPKHDITLAQIKQIWNDVCSRPEYSQYASFNDWFNEVKQLLD